MEKPQDWNSNSRDPIVAMADWAAEPENPTVTNLSLKPAQNRQKVSELRKSGNRAI
jgi:hypothetical protein